jgi:hypothetical protein
MKIEENQLENTIVYKKMKIQREKDEHTDKAYKAFRS